MHPAHLSHMLHNHMHPRLLVTCVTQPHAHPSTCHMCYTTTCTPPTCPSCYTTTCTPVYLLHVLHNQMHPTHVLHNPRPPVTHVTQPHVPPSTCYMCYTTKCSPHTCCTTPAHLSHLLHNHMHPAHLSHVLHNHMHSAHLPLCRSCWCQVQETHQM